MAASDTDEALAELAQNGATWAQPFVLFGRYLRIAEDAGIAKNRLNADMGLSTPDTKVRGANVDTLYGHAWIDLKDGPVVISTPDAGDRYFSIQIVDAFQSTFYYIGNRSVGSDARLHVLVPPGWSGEIPDGMARVDAPTAMLLAGSRVHVRGASDLPAALDIQSQLRMGALGTDPGQFAPVHLEENATGRFPYTSFHGAGAAFFDELCALLERIPPPPLEAERMQRFAPLGIGPGKKPSADERLAPILAAAIDRSVDIVQKSSAAARLLKGGWSWGLHMWREIPETDPQLRAECNWQGPLFHIAQESTSPAAATDSEGAPLNGANVYRMRFGPNGIPPVRAFWSVTMYAMPEMGLVENPIERYAIGSNIEDLVYGPDGSLDVIISRDPPPETESANWLPAAEGSFMLLARLYRPEAPILEKRFDMPSVVKVSG